MFSLCDWCGLAVMNWWLMCNCSFRGTSQHAHVFLWLCSVWNVCAICILLRCTSSPSPQLWMDDNVPQNEHVPGFTRHLCNIPYNIRICCLKQQGCLFICFFLFLWRIDIDSSIIQHMRNACACVREVMYEQIASHACFYFNSVFTWQSKDLPCLLKGMKATK